LKKLLSVILVAIALFSFTFATPALAGDSANGATLFTKNCNQCHKGGKNLVVPAKSLKKEDLEKYGKYSLEAIKTQITNGAGAMPRFQGRLQPPQIEDIATYVLEKAEAGW